MTPNGDPTTPTAAPAAYNRDWCNERHDRIEAREDRIETKLDGLDTRLDKLDRRVVKIMAIGGTLITLAQAALAVGLKIYGS